MTGAEDHVTWIGTIVGGIAGGFAVGAAWVKRFVSKGIDSEALKQLKAVERKNAEDHDRFDKRIRDTELETSRQRGVLEQINERVGEVLDLMKSYSHKRN